MYTVELTEFADRHWLKSPTVLSGWPALNDLDPQRAFAVMARAGSGFRAGTRFFALPDVQFFTGEGRLRAPGDLLPTAADGDLGRYGKRLQCLLEGTGHLLVVREPLLLDFVLWSQVRALVAPLWRLVGQPVLPVTTHLVTADGTAGADALVPPSTHAVLAWVLSGRLTVELRRGRGVRRLVVTAGQTVHWPAGGRALFGYAPGTLVLRLLVATDYRLLHDATKDLVADALQRRRGDGRTPYLPYPPPTDATGALGAVEPLAAAAAGLGGMAGGGELDRALRTRWARTVSADALEPVPAPRAGIPLGEDLRVRLTAPVIRRPDGPDGWIWAVNGHAFTLRGRLGDRVLDRLGREPGSTVRELSGTGAGQRPDDPAAQQRRSAAIRGLLEKLYTLRGIDVPNTDR